jgi:hypothetical protein
VAWLKHKSSCLSNVRPWVQDPSATKKKKKTRLLKEQTLAGHQWFMPVIPATQEVEIRRIVVWSQPGQIICEPLSQINPSQTKAGGVAEGVGPEFKPQCC